MLRMTKENYDLLSPEEVRRQIGRLGIFSPEMLSEVTKKKPDADLFLDVISSSFLPLSRKKDLLWGKDREECEMALRELESRGDVFLLQASWYDPDLNEEKSDVLGLYPDLASAQNAMRENMREEEIGDEGVCTFLLDLYRFSDGQYQPVCRYRTVRDEAVYFSFDRAFDPETRERRIEKCGRMENLNLPVPFSAGDLLTAPMEPFAPSVTGILIEKGDNRDCCCLQFLFREPHTKKWTTCALKHGLFWTSAEGVFRTPVSPLFRLERAKKIPEEDGLLLRIRDHIGGREEKGRALWHAIHGYELPDGPDAELEAILREIGT